MRFELFLSCVLVGRAFGAGVGQTQAQVAKGAADGGFDNDFCARLPDGDFENPEESCSNHFFTCAGGTVVRQECAAAQLRFDAVSGTCQPSEHVSACGGESTTTEEPEKRKGGSDPVPETGVECSSLEDGMYASRAEPCSRAFAACVGGEVTVMVCSGDTKFDVQSGRCLEEFYVEVCGGLPTPVPPPEDERPPVDFDCSQKADGNYPGSSGGGKGAKGGSECSSVYFSCSGGVATERECFGDLEFDVLSDRCLLAEFVEGCGGSRTTTTTPNTLPAEPVDFDCSSKEDGNYPPAGGEGKGSFSDVCSEFFYSCSGGVASERVCEAELKYDFDSDRCLEHAYVPACGGVATVPVEATTIPVETVRFGVDCSQLGDGVYPDGRGKCSRMYVSCVGGKGYEGQCAGVQTRYDPISEQCLSPGFVVDCGGVQTTTVPAEPFITPDPGFDCSSLPDGDYARAVEVQQQKGSGGGGGSSCTREYISCVAGQAILRACPVILRYDVISNRCLSVEFVEACGGVSTTPQPEPQEEEQVLPDLEVVCGDDGLFHDRRQGRECSRYFAACVSGEAITMQCAGNTRFDPDTDRCIHAAYIAICGGTPTSETPAEGETQEIQEPQAPQKVE